MTAPLREPRAATVHASWIARLARHALARALAVSALVGVFLAFMGVPAHGWGFASRLVYMLTVSWIATLMAVGLNRFSERLGWAEALTLRQAGLTTVLMTLPMGLLVWSGDLVLAPRPPRVEQIPTYAAVSLVISGFMNLLAWGLARRPTVVVVQPDAPAPPKFLQRLPLRLRGAEVWAVSAEDHYLRLHTSRGEDLILMRMADAVAELEGIEGARVHRSWWVARDAVTEVRRDNGRAALKLKGGAEAPVSRSYARALRDKRWF